MNLPVSSALYTQVAEIISKPQLDPVEEVRSSRGCTGRATQTEMAERTKSDELKFAKVLGCAVSAHSGRLAISGSKITDQRMSLLTSDRSACYNGSRRIKSLDCRTRHFSSFHVGFFERRCRKMGIMEFIVCILCSTINACCDPQVF